jgi:hypothetical protein
MPLYMPSAYLAYTRERLNIYLRRKVGCVFICFVYHVEISQATAPLVALLVPLESPSRTRGAPSWFHNVLTYNGEVINIEQKYG